MFNLEQLEEIKWQVEKHMEHPNALLATTRLHKDQYEIIKLEEITERAFVYKALELSSGNCVSIKEFFPREALGLEDQLYFERDFETGGVKLQDSTDFKVKQFKSLIDGFIEEAKYLEKISYGDPIIRITDSFKDLSTAYIVTSYNEWPSLQDFLDAKHLFDEKELEWIVTKLLEVVVRFHRRSIVHRNVNSRNIYIMADDLVIDSLGTCDFLQDIKIYDADAYHNKYYAPEVMMHNGVIGTWTDVYAIGKVMIDVITHMSDQFDYFEGLKTIENKQVREAYAKSVKSSIAFHHEDRIQNALIIRQTLFGTRDDDRSYRTPRSMIAIIAMITILSSLAVFWQSNRLHLIANNEDIFNEQYPLSIEEENIPAGALIMFDVLISEDSPIVFEAGEEPIITWKKSDISLMKNILISLGGDDLHKIPLNPLAEFVDLTEVDLEPETYDVVIEYEMDHKIIPMTFKIIIQE